MCKFLVKRGNVWWFKRDVPKRLVPIVGRTAWTKSLEVYTLDEARRLQPEHAAWAYAEEAKAVALLKAGWKPTALKPSGDGPTPEEIEAADELSAMSAAEDDAAMAAETFYSEQYGDELDDAERSISDKPLFALSKEQAVMALLARRAAAAERKAAWDEGARGFVKYGGLSELLRKHQPPVASEEKPLAKRTVNDLLKAYVKAKTPEWAPSSAAAFVPVSRLLADTIGDREVATITREDARGVQEIVTALPKNLGTAKALRGLTVPEAVKRAKKLGLPVIAPTTQNGGYLIHITALFSWAVREEWATRNPFLKLTVADPVADADKRDPFTIAQLNTLFSSGHWDAPNEARPGRYWVPLLGLFQGARRAELAGLEVQDVVEIDGIPALHIRPNSLRALKTVGSRRTVPVHPELLRLGFMEYVKRRREAAKPTDRLFIDALGKARGQFGYNIGNWFGDRVEEAELSGKLLGLHSLRHSFEDELRRIGLHGTPLGLGLAGRDEGGSAAGYGNGYTMGGVLEALSRVTYPGLKLPTPGKVASED
jgi:integrase